MIGLWIWDEVSFNASFNNHKNLAEVMVTQTMDNESGTDESCAVPPRQLHYEPITMEI